MYASFLKRIQNATSQKSPSFINGMPQIQVPHYRIMVLLADAKKVVVKNLFSSSIKDFNKTALLTVNMDNYRFHDFYLHKSGDNSILLGGPLK